MRSHPSKLASQRAGTGQKSTRGHYRNKDTRALRNAREALRGFGKCGTEAEREGRGRSLQARRSWSQPARATMRVHMKAVQMTLLVCLLATTVCVKGAFLFIASSMCLQDQCLTPKYLSIGVPRQRAKRAECPVAANCISLGCI